LSLIFPFILGLSETRLHAGCIAFAYFGAALAPCIRGSQVFFEQASLFVGLLLWALWTVVLAGIFVLCWHRRRTGRAASIAVGLVLHAMLPAGLASPLLSAGVLFPATGFFGCFFVLLLCLSLAHRSWSVMFVLLAAAILCQIGYSPSRGFPKWQAVNTNFGGSAFRPLDPAASFRDLMWISARAKTSPGQVLLFPENCLRDYSDAVTGDWIDLPAIRAQRTILVLGTDRIAGAWNRRENVLLVRGAAAAEYLQRIPVPIAMWGRDTDAHLFGPGTFDIGSHRAAVLLCYEQLLVLPVLQSFSSKPDILLAASNLYWAKNTNVDAVEEMSVRSWARLFHVPYLRAVNR
jgi:hypothetical protein